MSAPAEIIERIKKLLRLARSANQHEAALAMEKAMALAAEHRVEVEKLDVYHDAARVTHRDHEDRLARLSDEYQFAARICQRFFRVRCIVRNSWHTPEGKWLPVSREYIALVGTATDVEIALYVLGFLVHHFRFCWRHHRGRVRNRRAFLTGMFRGLHAKLAAAEPPVPVESHNALIVSHDAYIAAHIGKTTDRANREDDDAHAALLAGWHQGQKTQIHGGLKPGAPAPLALQ
jgi:hypothetical protein